MIIDKKIKGEIEAKMRMLMVEVEQDQETLHNIFIRILNKGLNVPDSVMEDVANEIGYTFIGPDIWIDRGKKVKVLVLHQEKGNFYKRLGLCSFGCITQVGELMSIEKR